MHPELQNRFDSANDIYSDKSLPNRDRARAFVVRLNLAHQLGKTTESEEWAQQKSLVDYVVENMYITIQRRGQFNLPLAELHDLLTSRSLTMWDMFLNFIDDHIALVVPEIKHTPLRKEVAAWLMVDGVARALCLAADKVDLTSYFQRDLRERNLDNQNPLFNEVRNIMGRLRDANGRVTSLQNSLYTSYVLPVGLTLMPVSLTSTVEAELPADEYNDLTQYQHATNHGFEGLEHYQYGSIFSYIPYELFLTGESSQAEDATARRVVAIPAPPPAPSKPRLPQDQINAFIAELLATNPADQEAKLTEFLDEYVEPIVRPHIYDLIKSML